MPLLTLPGADATPRSARAKALVFEDPASQRLLAQIEQVAASDATVLVSGETGTGKEIVARHIHELSPRARRPFVAVNCGALTETLIESELFGHDKGAFTGAHASKAGWFEAAQGGTLFLDELGELPLHLQVKLLRVLQEREVVRLGSRTPVAIDVRLVAATNVDLPAAVAAGKFRADLYYRLNVAPVTLLPLRERPGDIAPLAAHFLESYRQRLGAGRAVLGAEALERLTGHTWPGNIRELENVIHHALVVCRGERILPEDLRFAATAAFAAPAPAGKVAPAAPAAAPEDALAAALRTLFEQDLPNLHERIEAVLMRTAYAFCDENQLQTARLLGISRNVVRARLIHCGALAGTLRSSATSPSPARGVVAHAPAPAPIRVRIGYQKFGLLVLLKARGTFERALAARGAGDTVEWLEFPGGTQLAEALAEGRIDLGIVGEGPPILAQAAGARLVYLAAEPPAPEAEAIVVHNDSDIRTVADLKGKTVAVNRGANVDYLLRCALHEAHLSYDDIKVAFVAPTGARAAFESREVDAWAIWNPLLASVAHGGARVLRDATGLAANTAYYVGGRDFADAHAPLVADFLAEVRATGAWANANPDAVLDLLAPALGIARPALAGALAHTRFGAAPLDAAAVAAQQCVADAFHAQKLIPRPVRIADASWSPPLDR